MTKQKENEKIPPYPELCRTLFIAIKDKKIKDSIQYKNKISEIIQDEHGLLNELMKKTMKGKDKRTKVKYHADWAQTWLTKYLELIYKKNIEDVNGKKKYELSLTKKGNKIKNFNYDELLSFFEEKMKIYRKKNDEWDNIFNKKFEDFNELNSVDSNEYETDLSPKSKKSKKSNINRKKFRNLFIKRDGCDIVGCHIKIDQLLVASHIKPVNEIENEMKQKAKELFVKDDKNNTDPKIIKFTKKKFKILESTENEIKSIENEIFDVNNGFWLCGTHDKIFDRFIISFDKKGKLLYSDSIKGHIDFIYEINEPNIRLKDGNEKYLEFHNKMHEKNRDISTICGIKQNNNK